MSVACFPPNNTIKYHLRRAATRYGRMLPKGETESAVTVLVSFRDPARGVVFVFRAAYVQRCSACSKSDRPSRRAALPGLLFLQKVLQRFFSSTTETRLYNTRGEHAQQRVFLAQPCEGDLHLAACPHTEGEWGGRDGYACGGGTSYRHQPRRPAMPSRRRRFRRFRYTFR